MTLLPPYPQYHNFTLLGVRFWDPVEGGLISEGLSVRAWPENHPSEKVHARVSGAGVYAFHRLPGMRDLEFPVDGQAPWDSPTRKFVVEARDQKRRFIPMVCVVSVPHKGIFPTHTGISSPPSTASGAVLFSAPTRQILPGWAVVRASLLDSDREAPAAYAVLDVRVNGQEWHGISSENGNVLVTFPYPNFQEAKWSSSPPVLNTQKSWPVQVRIRYQPTLQKFPSGSRFPTFNSVWAQNEAVLDVASPVTNELSTALFYQKPLILPSPDVSFISLTALSSP